MKYQNENERRNARRLQNREAKRRQRANIKLSKESEKAKLAAPISIAQAYNTALYTECSKYPFSHSITLTNNKMVTLNMNNKAVEDLIENLKTGGYITNYIKTNEFTGNYHSHLVVQEAYPGVDFRLLLRQYWSADGFFKVVPIYTDSHRLNAIKYCFKQIDVTSNRALIQALVDTWSTCLVQTFKDLKRTKSALVNAYKITNGLQVYWKDILKKNGGTK